MTIAVVAGTIASFPVGGVFYDYIQYALGLECLGLDVYYLEDTNMPPYDPVARDWNHYGEWGPNIRYLEGNLAAVSPRLADRWHVRTDDGQTFGMSSSDIASLLADADLFVNVSGIAVMRDEYLACSHKVYIDTDPGWNHFARWPKADRQPDAVDRGWRAHDHFFTYAERLGRPSCPLPDFGFEWHPTRPPVIVDLWPHEGPGESWTTVLSWDNFGWMLEMEHEGMVYGTKEREFPKIEDLPARVPVALEVAAGGTDPPVDHWRALGWSVRDSLSVSRTPEDYNAYVCGSRGEFSVAKHVLVATRCGWFSCRSTCYLAAGRPVVLQDTGFSEVIPTGEGVLAFSTAEEAAAALAAVESDWTMHSEAARKLAESEFSSEVVLSDMLNRVDLGG